MIYCNGRFLTQNVTGVQRFAIEIGTRLAVLTDVTFLVPDLSLVKFDHENKKINIVEVKGFSGHLWEQVTLPLFLKKNGDPLLVNLCNTAPIFYRHQVVTHHDITYIKYPQSYPFIFRKTYEFIARKIIKNAKSIITVSEFSKREICEYYRCDESRVSVIYNAVSDFFKPKSNSSEGDYILAVSSPNYHKNFHGLLEAFTSMDLDIKLKIIGSASKTFSHVNLNIDDNRVEFLGRVDDEALIKLYQNAKLFVFPSFYEGFGIPPLEAQACGCPVASSNRASMCEVLGDSAVYFNPHSKNEICESISKIINDHSLGEELKKSGFENIKRFSWESSAKKIFNKINEIT